MHLEWASVRKYIRQRSGRRSGHGIPLRLMYEKCSAQIYERLSFQAMENAGGAREECKLAGCAPAKVD